MSNTASSKLGTKAYWDQAYTGELKVNAEYPDDQGTIWFDENQAEEKTIEFLENKEISSLRKETNVSNKANQDLKLLDLGTGNGHILFAMEDEGWQARMLGVDYSEKSIDLAQQIKKQRMNERNEQSPTLVMSEKSEIASEGTTNNVEFLLWDILGTSIDLPFQHKFDVILDKGTFDAISLNKTALENGRTAPKQYVACVPDLLQLGGILLITSCNWTEQELQNWFADSGLSYSESIRYPSFTFGGIKGQTISTVCFQKR